MLHKFSRIFISLALEALNEFILELHSHLKDGEQPSV